ncbi:MAG: acyltransferase [Clostridiaceae bacterium]|nr:acyltransferase [Clostridiaceae bacterium]
MDRRTSDRNSEIELLRFLFACGIVLCHYAAVYDFSFFSRGAIGVEYFFLLSGLLMARSARKIVTIKDSKSTGAASWDFLKKKILAFYPYYLFGMLFSFLFVRTVLRGQVNIQTLIELLNGIPQYLMLEMSGAYVDGIAAISGRWYLSSMLLAMAILFPVFIRLDRHTARILFILIGIFGLGYLKQNYNGIMENYVWNGFAGLGLIRGISEIALGTICFDAAQWISNIRFTLLGKLLVTSVKICCYLSAFLYGNNILMIDPLIVLFLLMAAVTLSYSRCGWMVDDIPVFSCSGTLGKISLPLYIMHVPISEMVQTLAGYDFAASHVPYIILLCLSVAALLPDFLEIVKKNMQQLGRFIFVH